MKKIILLLLVSISVFSQDLKGKKIYFYGDSITFGFNVNGYVYPNLVSNYYGAVCVNNAKSNSTMMKQEPVNILTGYNMEYMVETVPDYNQETDGLIFIAFLTNDVGINLTNYTVENYGKAVDNIIKKLLDKGWTADKIKFNARYYITTKGLNYVPNMGITIPADFNRYNAFSDILKKKLDGYGIQYFDFFNILSDVPNADSHLDWYQRHPDAYMHTLIAKNITENLKVTTLNIKTFELDNTFTNIEYFNLLGQKVKEPKGIVIVKAEKNGIIYTKKVFK